jgi:hypothetical protein
MANAGARVPTMEKRCFWIPTSPEPAPLLYTDNTSEAHAEYLAGVASRHSEESGPCRPNIRRG